MPNELTSFIRETFRKQNIENAVIALSGGIDSAVSLTLLTIALTPENITPILLPYGDQDMTDARVICNFNHFNEKKCLTIDIKPIVDQICHIQQIETTDQLRRGNIMARVRMILVFDTARKKNALVCGTENKTEHFLGYFTRFGDAASDIEPIAHLYKTQVRSLAGTVRLPQQLIDKTPSAGLWDMQTDEKELGFSYAQADQVLEQLIDHHVAPENISLPNVSPEVITKIIARVDANAFKLHVPYTFSK
jgi:NAD+ synthase